jgi:hypothetical protein
METTTLHNTVTTNIQAKDNWSELCNCMEETFRFTEDEKNAFSKDRVAQLIAALPFEAGCDEPKRTALAHLAIYLTELRGGRNIGDHTPEDNKSPLTRLRLLSSFKGGDTKIIEHGMHQLALVMLAGYIHSKESDKKESVYNPLNDHSWNADKMQEEILEIIRKNPVENLDYILPEVLAVSADW